MGTSSTLTRRGLLRGFGTVTVVGGCASSGAHKSADGGGLVPEASSATLGPGAARLELTINGNAVATEVPPSTTLLSLLRDHLHMTGTKEVCDRGACGACMVLVDGDAMNACMMLAHDVAGRAVTTVEGIGGGALSALQAEILAQDGAQCGFCTPGMLIAATSLLRDGVAERAEIERGMAGNLCRCGSYPHILSAIERVARGSADA